jgi:hypothetical protein
MVYLIGADHEHAQRRKRGEALTDDQLSFKSVVESAIQSVHFCLLAEEDHADFLSGPSVTPEKVADSILLEIARAHGIENRHRFVDPNQEEREKIGYQALSGQPYDAVPMRAHEIMHQFPKREEFWLRKMQDFLDRDILFICGWGHIGSFSALLARNGVSFSIWADKIGARPHDLEFDDAVQKYIADNSAKFNNPNCFCRR